MKKYVSKENLQEFATKFRKQTIAEKFVDNLKFGDVGLLNLYDDNYTSCEGMCVIDNQYMVVC